jgi:murein DD-endopeptidase MepM/ murein hydrolase activator NlpD
MSDLSGMPGLMSQSDINSIMDLAKQGGALASNIAQKLRNIRAQADRQLEGAMGKATSTPFKNPPPEQKQLTRGKVWPVNGKISQNFGGVNWEIYPGRTYQGKYYPHFHNGLDIAASRGTPIRAYDAGQVTFVGISGAYGMHVVLSHPGGLSTSYSHMDTGSRGPTVRKGDYVSAGETLGYIGMTGMTTGPHIHFVVRDQKDVINPRNVLP